MKDMRYLEKIKERMYLLGRTISIPLVLGGLSSYALSQEHDNIKTDYLKQNTKIEIREKGDNLEQIVGMNSKIESEIFDKIKGENYIRVIVELHDEEFNKDKFKEYKEKIRIKEDSVLSELSDSDFSLRFKYKTIPGFAGEITLNGLKKLNNDNNVKSVYLDSVFHTSLAQSVPLINADDAHRMEINSINIKGDGQVIAIIDDGIDYTHPDLGGCFGADCKVIGGYDFVNNDADPDAIYGHGTHVAGIAAANGGVIGVAPNAKLLAIKVCDVDCSASTMIAGSDWCIDNKDEFEIDVLSMSIGFGNYNSSNCPTWMDSVINRAYSFNLPFVIASGNDGFKNGINSPACSLNAISVGAVYDTNLGQVNFCVERDVNTRECLERCTENATRDKVSCFSNSADILDMMAPGADIRSTTLNGGYEGGAGTSAAAPHVSGTIALMKQVNPNLKYDEIVNILKTTGVPVTDEGNGLVFPRIDTLAAVFCSLEGEILEDRIQCPRKFIRADANNDKTIDISDPIKTLLYLFNGSGIDCMDAADSDDDGRINLTDPIHTLGYIFGRVQLSYPYPLEGYDYVNTDNLRCIY